MTTQEPNTFSRRHLFAMGGGLAAAMALAACGGSDGSDSASTTTPGTDGGSSTSAAGSSPGTTNAGTVPGTTGAGTAPGTTAAGGGSDITLSQWYHEYGEVGVQEAVERYGAAYSDATIEVVWKPGDYDQATPAALLTDDGPDVFEYGNGPTLDMIQAGQVVDMTDLFGDTLSDFNEALIKRVTWDGKIWAIPQMLDMQCLIYRKSMFDDAGVTPPETIDDLIAAAAALNSGDVKGLYLGEDGGAGLMGGPMLWASGQDYINDDNEVGFTAEAAGAAMAKLREIWESDTLLLGTPEDWWSATPFINGQTAMQFTGLWTFPAIIEALGDDFGVLPWPSMPDGAPSVTIGAYGACVSAKASDVEAARAYAKWLWIDQTEYQLDFATAYGYHVPARNSLSPQATTLESGPGADGAALAASVGRNQNHMLWTPTTSTAFTDAMNRIVKEGADPVAELQSVIDTANDELARVLG